MTKKIKEPVYLLLPLRGAPFVACEDAEVTIHWLLPRAEVQIVLSLEDALALEDRIEETIGNLTNRIDRAS